MNDSRHSCLCVRRLCPRYYVLELFVSFFIYLFFFAANGVDKWKIACIETIPVIRYVSCVAATAAETARC